ncbi:helix-turn-helix domain-containing protein [Promicromonospora sukumoe]|uniref:helix-turn-helix domain-containing protein n=1 Tax=Promicromonospora sukumoe TaxID=88382 RepID=UPI0037C68A53
MAITWSRLHELLGIRTARRLVIADIEGAIVLDLDEDEALDFKARLRSDEAAKVEFAKDVAAMANSGGGLIVLGVSEEGEDKHLSDAAFEIPAEPEQSIHQILAARVRPLVRPVVEPIRRDGENVGYLLVQIPDSPGAPHFYEHKPEPKNPPGAPFRHGSGTLMMREHDIERAYRDRFARQTDALVRLEHLVNETSGGLGFTDRDARHWAVVATTPLSSPPIGAPRPDANAVRAARDAARGREYMLYADVESGGPLNEISHTPRRGLRRWIMRNEFLDPEAPSTTRAYAELHDDGSSVLAFPVAATPQEYGREEVRSAINASWVQATCASAVVMADEWLAARRIAAGATMLATIVTNPTDSKPIWAALSMDASGFTNPQIQPATRPVRQVLPVDSAFDAPRDLTNMRAAAVDLAEAILHQFGVVNVNQLARPGH